MKYLKFRLLKGIEHGITLRGTRIPLCFRLKQTHSNKVIWIWNPKGSGGEVPEADGVLTRSPDLCLAVLVADCVPILLYEPKKRIIGAVHAGWAGTVGEVLKEAIKKIKSKNILIGIGPSIGPCCYDDVDLKIENKLQAREEGIPEKNIEIMPYCTKCRNDLFYSWRAGDKNKRFAAFIKLKNAEK